MEIWLKTTEDKVMIPVLPSSFQVQSPQNNETVTTVNGKEVTLIGERGLRSISWSSFIPREKSRYLERKANYNGKPYAYLARIGKMKGKVITLVITGTSINYQATIENLEYREEDGSGDVYYSIELKEYKGIEIKKNNSQKSSEIVDKNATKIKKVETKTKTREVKSEIYTVRKGDTLTSIAKKKTGSSSNWCAIYNQNKKVIGSNPNRILIGQKLVIKV